MYGYKKIKAIKKGNWNDQCRDCRIIRYSNQYSEQDFFGCNRKSKICHAVSDRKRTSSKTKTSLPLGVCLFQDDKTWVEPDITVIRKKERLTDEGVNGAPDLSIEVVSSSNSAYDYFLKMLKYQQAGVREYWIVDPKLQVVSVYNFEEFDKSKRYEYTDVISSNVLKGFEICIPDFIEEY